MAANAAVTRASSDAVKGSDSLHLLYFGYHLAQPGLDSLLEGDRGCRAAVTRPTQAQKERSILLVKVHHLDLAPMRRDIRTQGVESALDPVKNIHAIL